MATINGDNLFDIQRYGEYGHEDCVTAGATLAAANIADTVDLARIDGPAHLTDAVLFNAALGASTTVSLGWRYQDGSAGGGAAVLLAASATSTAGRVSGAVAPAKTTKGIVIYATIGGAAATGRIDVAVRYKALGGK